MRTVTLPTVRTVTLPIECKECGCMPKADEWAYEGADYCYDCSPLYRPNTNFPQVKCICPKCKGNGYINCNGLYKENIIQCRACNSQGQLYA